MPMQWDTANEAKLFAAIYQVADVKLSGAQLSQIAKYIGPDCTPKAITHRLAAIRKRANALGDDDAAEPEPKAKKANTGGRKKKPAAAKEPSPAGSDEDDDEEMKSTAKKRKREQQDGIEVGEDIGQGLRAGGREIKAEDEEWV